MKREVQALILAAKAGEIPAKLDPAGFPDIANLRLALAGDMAAALTLREKIALYNLWAAAPALPDKIRVAFNSSKGVAKGEAKNLPKAMAIALVNLWGLSQ